MLSILLTITAATAQPHAAVHPDAAHIPAGTFEMGCVPADPQCEPTEIPRRAVTLTRPFWLARTETSVGQYRRFVTDTGYRTEADKRGQGRFWRFDINEWDWVDGLSWRVPFAADQPAPDNWPAVQLAWADADAYCRWVGGRLPTEAEWERAARGGIEGQISVWGNAPTPMVDGVPQANGPDISTAREFTAFAAFRDYYDGFARIAPVASFPSNAYGLHDMAGNAYEWIADWIEDGPYPTGPQTDPRGLPNGEIKAVRGAGWGYPPEQFRISFRGIAGLDFWTATFGFRCAWDQDPATLSQGQ
ncbi:MAG: formylglycine-generating enzyme family protein [Sphingopyxis sp.]|nr:formylglycine-generating enzyme family protein [Sphingopyxis sp.]